MRRLIRLIPVLLIMLMIPILACSCKEKELGSFALSIYGPNLSWENVEGAEKYGLTCTTPDGTSYTIIMQGNSFVAPQTATGDYLYTVTAYNAKESVIAQSVPALYHIGTGSFADPIPISSADELCAITSGSITATFGTTKVSAPLYYIMTADVDLSNVEMTPIGTQSDPFQGCFDGNGHTISNLTITMSNSVGRIGLFGNVSKAIIKNLTLANASMILSSKSKVTDTGLEFGLLAAHTIDTVIDNCHVTGSIDILSDVMTTGSYGVDVGGLVGNLSGGKIFASSFTGSIKARYSQVFVGGIVGYATSGTQKFVLTNCLSSATINAYATGDNGNAKARAGILIGSLSGAERISTCVANGSVKAMVSGNGASGSDANISSGVFGNTAGSSTENTIPMINIFYLDTILSVSGTRSVLGSGNTAYALSAEEMKEKRNYIIGDTTALDFDSIWTMGAEHPVLKGIGQSLTHKDVSIVVSSELNEKEYNLSMQDTFLPLYYSLTINNRTQYFSGYRINDLLTNLGISTEGAKEVIISGEGMNDLVMPVSNESVFSSVYLLYGSYGAYSKLPETFTGIQILNTNNSTFYEVTGDILSITVVKKAEE